MLSPTLYRLFIRPIREFRADVRVGSRRWELSRFPNQEARLQWLTDSLGFHLWWGCWELNIYRI